MKFNSKVKYLVVIGAMLGVLTIGGIMAYFSDGDTATNTFTVGKVSIDLQEPSWDPDDTIDLVPGEDIPKDPQVKNDGINDEYVFMEVIIPYANVITANEDGTANTAADTELFSYDVNTGWIEVGSSKKDTASKTVPRLYAYGTSSTMTALSKNTTTPALFDTIRFANIIEDGGLGGTNLNVVINAYGIQTTSINKDSNGVAKTAPVDVWAVLKNQNPSTTVNESEDPKTDIKSTTSGS